MATPGKPSSKEIFHSREGTGNPRDARAEDVTALNRSKAFLLTVIDAIPDLTLVLDRDYRILLANRAAREMADGTDPVAACMTCYQLSHHRDTPCQEGVEPCPLKQVIATKRPVTVEHTYYDTDNNEIYAEVYAAPIFDEAGEVVQIIQVSRDITDRKLAGEALRKSERKYRVLFERSADATLIIDDNKFVDCNDAVVEMLRYSNKVNLLRTHPSELSPETQPDGRPSFEKANEMMAIAFEKGSHRFEWDHKRVDGEVFPVEVLLTAVPSEDRRILHVVWRDITDRKRTEKDRDDLIAKLEAQNAELERFTYTVSHDLKSPLITLKGFMGLLKEDLAAGNAQAIADDMARMASAADKMGQLLKELLELSRIGRVVNAPEDVPLGEIVRDAVELVGGRITQAGTQVEIAPDMPIIYGDRHRLVEVLQNLIENAVKWTADRSDPRIEIGARQDRHETVCYVRDNGMGIDPRYHEKIFDLFEKLDSRSEGTGVGLALVKRIIELHGGRIWVESKGMGQGSTFCFTLARRTDSTERKDRAK